MNKTAGQVMADAMVGLSICITHRYACYIGGLDKLPRPLSHEEERTALLCRDERDVDARNTLVEHNLRLVIYIARKFANTRIGIEDIISIGTIGLIKAVNSFNIEKGIKLSTYASRCIENEILLALRRAKHMRTEVFFGGVADDGWADHNPLISSATASDKDLVSRDMDDIEDRKALHSAVTKLNNREREIIDLRFGLHGGRTHTQKEVAEMMGFSQSYISRIEKEACKQLRATLLS